MACTPASRSSPLTGPNMAMSRVCVTALVGPSSMDQGLQHQLCDGPSVSELGRRPPSEQAETFENFQFSATPGFGINHLQIRQIRIVNDPFAEVRIRLTVVHFFLQIT